MRRHRTTARGALLLLILAALGTGAASASTRHAGPAAPKKTVQGAPILFPLIGPAEYGNSYGDARANGSHAGIDIMTGWRTPAVAAEDGRVRFWTTSARAGCMLYLYGASGTTYLYIHLNNDLTPKHDNKGSCVPGVAYATGLTNGARVKAGQQIGYNGDSGDAEGNYHLHFEVHPDDGQDVNPFPYLNAATRLLFPARAGQQVSLALRGTPVSAGAGTLELAVSAVRWWPGGRWTQVEDRIVELTVPDTAELDEQIATAILAPARRSLATRKGLTLTAFTGVLQATPEAMRGGPGALTVERVSAS